MPYGTEPYGTEGYGGSQAVTRPVQRPIGNGIGYGGGAYGTIPYGGTALPEGPVSPVTLTAICLFLTPQVQDESPFLPDSPRRETNLWRHFQNRWRHVNVWQRSDGTFCQDTATPTEAAMTQPAAYISRFPIGPDETETFPALSDTNVNYPWNPFPSDGQVPGEYVFVTNWDQTTQTEVLDPYLATWFQPGAYVEVTQAEALVLTAAGFGDCIS